MEQESYRYVGTQFYAQQIIAQPYSQMLRTDIEQKIEQLTNKQKQN